MKNRILFISLAVVLAISLVVVGCGGPVPGERTTIALDFVTFWPAGDFQAGVGHENWMNTISDLVLARTPDDETGYKIEWTKFYGVHPAALLTDVQSGVYDVGTSGPGYTKGVMPLWAGPEYPAELNRKNALTMSMTLQALHDESPALQAEFTAVNLKLMHLWSTGPGYFLMTEGNAVTTLADFPGKTIRAANPASVVSITALGASPLYCPMSVALEKFEAGLLDGILCPTDTPKGFGLAAYVTSATFAPCSYHFVFMKVMNKGTWADLPAEVQDIFNEVNAEYPEYYGKLRTWGEYDGIKYCETELGDDWYFYDLPAENPAEYASWAATTAGLIDNWIAGDATKQAMWDLFVDLDADMTAEWGGWTHSWPTPPTPPTFP